jgi:hypothetical protein
MCEYVGDGQMLQAKQKEDFAGALDSTHVPERNSSLERLGRQMIRTWSRKALGVSNGSLIDSQTSSLRDRITWEFNALPNSLPSATKGIPFLL